MLILDTNILIPVLRENSTESIWLRKKLMKESLIFCPIVIAEFLVRASKKEQSALAEMTSFWGIAEMDYDTCRIAALYRQKYHSKTKAVYMLDCLVAACTKITNSTLVTHNKSDYPMRDIKIISPK